MELTIILIVLFISFVIYNTSPTLKEPFQPDERQYAFCNNSSILSYGIQPNIIKEPSKEKGVFTTLLNKNENYKPLTDIPYCNEPEENQYIDLNTDYFPDDKIINYKDNNYESPIDPFDPYPPPTDNYSILYSPTIQSEFMKHNRLFREKNIMDRKNEFMDN